MQQPNPSLAQVNQTTPDQPEIAFIRWPFRVLAGLLAIAFLVPMLFIIAQIKPLPWSGLLMVGWSTLVLAMLSITGKPWPNWARIQATHGKQS